MKHKTELSHREQQVLDLLVAGGHPAQVARQLNLSPKTASTYRKRIGIKLGLKGAMRELDEYIMKQRDPLRRAIRCTIVAGDKHCVILEFNSRADADMAILEIGAAL